MRHAKSDWHSHTADIDRPLNERGSQDALRMGEYLNQMNLVPDRMIVSSAQRTRQTAELLLHDRPLAEKAIVFDKALYLAGTSTLRETIELYASEDQRLLILAHNPGMDYLVSYLASTPPPLTDSGKLMTTCAVACFSMGSLDELKKPGQAKLTTIFRPGEIIFPK